MINRTFKPFPILTTARLTLRPLEVSDRQEIFSLRSDSEINKYLDRKMCDSINDARDFIDKVNDNVRKNDSLYWAISLANQQRLVGTICLFNFSDKSDTCEIGYELLTQFQSRGIMREAVESVINYAFNSIKVKRIDAFFHAENERSIKLLKKFSFEHSNEPDKTNPDLLYYFLTNLASL